MVLLGLLVVLIGWYSYDYFVAKPSTMAADTAIQKLADERNKQGIKAEDGTKLGDGRVVSADIQKLLGRAPSSTKQEKEYTVETYWWYSMPHRNYLSVLYVGNEPRRYNAHYLNSLPPTEDLPGDFQMPARAEPTTPVVPASSDNAEKPADKADADKVPAEPATEKSVIDFDKPATEADKPASDK